MANKFLLTAQLNLSGVGNVKPVLGQLQKQINGLKANINLNLTSKTVSNILALNKNLAVTKQLLDDCTKSGAAFNSSLSGIAQTVNTATKGTNANNTATQNLNKNMQAVTSSTKQATNGMFNFGKSSAQAIKKFGAFTTVTSSIISVGIAVKSAVREALEFQNGLVKLSQISGVSTKNLSGLSKEISKLSTELGVSSTELLAVSDTLAQAGLTIDEVKTALEGLAKTKLAPTFGDLENTVEASIAAMKQFNIPIEDLKATLGTFNAVAAAFAVEADDISVAVRRAGGAFEASGGSLEEFIALFTSVRQTTREGAETIATGFRTIFTRLQRPKTLEFLKTLGVELLTLEGQFVGPYEAVRRLSSALSEVESTDPRFAQIVEELGGFRQVSKVIPLIQQVAVAEKALAVARRGRTSLDRDAVTAQESVLVQLTKLREKFFELFRTVGNNDAVRSFITLTVTLADSLLRVADSLGNLIPLFATLGALKLGAGLTSFSKGFGQGIAQPRKFAKGGMVPGQGNRDTVPAMLMPGEYVLPKSAVQSIGVQNIQKFAEGGTVQALKKKQFGLISLFQDPNPDNLVPVSPERKTIDAAYINKRIGVKTELKQGGKGGFNTKSIGTGIFDTEGNYNYDLYSGTVNQGFADSFEAQIQKDLVGIANNEASRLSSMIADGSTVKLKPSDINKFNFEQISGNLFEAALTGLGAPYTGDGKTSSTDAFDFFGGVPSALAKDVFKNENIASVPSDAKRTLSAATKNSVSDKIIDLMTGVIVDDKLSKLDNDTKGRLQNVKNTFLASKQRPADVNRARDSISNFSRPLGITGLPKDKSPVDIVDALVAGRRFAKGGLASGADTVPAMLTPGEYVLDKATAQRIGYGNLESIRKYNKGGFVKKYATGGSVTGNAGGIGNFGAILLVLPALTSLLEKVNGSLSQTVTDFATLGVTAAFLGKQFLNTEKTAKETSKTEALSLKYKDKLTKQEQKTIASRAKFQSNLQNAQTKRSALIAATGTRAEPFARKDFLDSAKASNLSFTELQSEKRRQVSAQNRLNKANSLRFRARINKGASIVGAAGAAGGVVASGIGEFIQKDVRSNIEQGKFNENGPEADTLRTGAAISTAGTAATTGAAIGSFAGPLGTAIGAGVGLLAGAAYGFFVSGEEQINEAKKTVQAFNFNKSVEGLGKDLGLALSGKADKAFIQNKIRTNIIDLQKNITGASGDSKQQNELLRNAEGQISGLTDLGFSIAGSVTSIEEFKKASNGLGNELIFILSRLTGESITEVEDSFQRVIKANQTAVKIQDSLTKANRELINQQQLVNKFVRAFFDAGEAVDNFTSTANAVISDFKNISLDKDISGGISGGISGNSSSFQSALQQLLGGIGPEADTLITSLSQTAAEAKQLPQILVNAANQSLKSPDGDQRGGLIGSVEEQIKGFGPQLQSVILSALENQLSADSVNQDFLAGVKSNPEKFAQDLLAEQQAMLDALAKAGEVAVQKSNEIIKLIQARGDIEKDINSQSIGIAKSSAQLRKSRGAIGSGAFASASELNSTDLRAARLTQSNIRLGGIGGGRDAASLGQSAVAKNNELAELQKKLQSASLLAADGVAGFANTIVTTEGQVSRLTDELRDMAENTSVLNALTQELNNATELRGKKNDLATDLSFGGREGRADFAKSIGLASIVAKNPNAIGSQDQEQKALQGLDKLIQSGAGDVKLGQFGGRSANDVKNERNKAFLKAQGLSDSEADAVVKVSPEEIRLQKEIVAEQQNMVNAQEALRSITENKLTTLTGITQKGFTDMVNAFNNSIAQANLEKKQETANKAGTAADDANSKFDTVQRLRSNLDSVGVSNISELPVQEFKKIDDLKAQIANVSAGPTPEIQNRLNNLPATGDAKEDELRRRKTMFANAGVPDAFLEQAYQEEAKQKVTTGVRTVYGQGGSINIAEKRDRTKEELDAAVRQRIVAQKQSELNSTRADITARTGIAPNNVTTLENSPKLRADIQADAAIAGNTTPEQARAGVIAAEKAKADAQRGLRQAQSAPIVPVNRPTGAIFNTLPTSPLPGLGGVLPAQKPLFNAAAVTAPFKPTQSGPVAPAAGVVPVPAVPAGAGAVGAAAPQSVQDQIDAIRNGGINSKNKGQLQTLVRQRNEEARQKAIANRGPIGAPRTVQGPGGGLSLADKTLEIRGRQAAAASPETQKALGKGVQQIADNREIQTLSNDVNKSIVSAFTTGGAALTQSLDIIKNIPSTIAVTARVEPVQVIINGAEALNSMAPYLQKMVEQMIQKNLPGSGPPAPDAKTPSAPKGNK